MCLAQGHQGAKIKMDAICAPAIQMQTSVFPLCLERLNQGIYKESVMKSHGNRSVSNQDNTSEHGRDQYCRFACLAILLLATAWYTKANILSLYAVCY